MAANSFLIAARNELRGVEMVHLYRSDEVVIERFKMRGQELIGTRIPLDEGVYKFKHCFMLR